MEVAKLYFMGAKVDMAYVIGVSPLYLHTGVMDNLNYKELSFSLLLVHYPLEFRSGRRWQPPFEDPTVDLQEFRRLYNMLSAGLQVAPSTKNR